MTTLRPPRADEVARDFVLSACEAGWFLDWDPPSALELDRFLDHVGISAAQSIVPHVGAYFGELLVRNGAGVWTDEGTVRTPTGYTFCPREAVARRVGDTRGPSLATVYVFAMVGHPTLEDAEPDFGADVGGRMRTWAAIFTHDAALHGMLLDYDEESLEHVESMCEVLHRGGPDRDAVDELALTMGAYLGEVVIAARGGTWLLDEDLGALAIDLPNGLRCYPLQKVAQRLTGGGEHDLRLFHCLVTAGSVTDGARLLG